MTLTINLPETTPDPFDLDDLVRLENGALASNGGKLVTREQVAADCMMIGVRTVLQRWGADTRADTCDAATTDGRPK